MLLYCYCVIFLIVWYVFSRLLEFISRQKQLNFFIAQQKRKAPTYLASGKNMFAKNKSTVTLQAIQKAASAYVRA